MLEIIVGSLVSAMIVMAMAIFYKLKKEEQDLKK